MLCLVAFKETSAQAIRVVVMVFAMIFGMQESVCVIQDLLESTVKQILMSVPQSHAKMVEHVKMEPIHMIAHVRTNSLEIIVTQR
jgi:hypothetical protein